MTGGSKGLVINLGNEVGGFFGSLAGGAIVFESAARDPDLKPSPLAAAAGMGVALGGGITGAWIAGRAVGVGFWSSVGIAVLSNAIGWAGRWALESAGAPSPAPRLVGAASDFGVSYWAGNRWL